MHIKPKNSIKKGDFLSQGFFQEYLHFTGQFREGANPGFPTGVAKMGGECSSNSDGGGGGMGGSSEGGGLIRRS